MFGIGVNRSDQAKTSSVQQFALALQNYKLRNNNQEGEVSPFDVVSEFISITAQETLQFSDFDSASENKETFETYDLETKLWHLFAILYGFRVTSDEQKILPESKFSSDAVKQHNFLCRNKKIREVSLIINWLQENSKSTDIVYPKHKKWAESTQYNSEFGKLQYADADAPLREGISVSATDAEDDSISFKVLYNLILSGKIEEGIEYANETGNFTMSLILLGAVHDYIDPIVDKDNIDDNTSSTSPSGQKNKLLWRKSVYKLSQQTQLNYYEKLIYTYLCGGEISSNLKESEGWEEQLLIYLNQLFIDSMSTYLSGTKNFDRDVPSPQVSTVDEVLNILSKNNPELSQHPLRVFSGGIMIGQLKSLLHNTIKKIVSSEANDDDIDDYLIRVVTHLSILSYTIGTEDAVSEKDLTRILSLYITYLSKSKNEEYIPIYLSFIPNEADARECYSLFLSSLTDDTQRRKQIEIAKKFTDALTTNTPNPMASISDDNMDIVDEGKMINVLRRTVERVMVETESHYKLTGGAISVIEDTVDEVDHKLYRSVEWFYQNNMYEDAIIATIVVFRRFLLCGKLASLKEFARGKNFKQLIKDYDFTNNTKMLSSPNTKSKIDEHNKEELIQYDLLVQGLTLIDDWKKFLKDNQINGVVTLNNLTFWKSNHIHNSIEKVTTNLKKLIFTWFEGLIKSEDVSKNDLQIYKEFRSIYVPYLIMDILQIYQYSRLNDWKYMRFAFDLINLVADEEENDLLECFVGSGRLREFVSRTGELAAVASENGIKGIFY